MTSSLRVLLVEDDPVITELCRMLLSTRNLQAQCVATGAEARAQLDQEESRFSLLIVDLSLPDMRGEALIQWAPDIPAVCISGTKVPLEVLQQGRQAPTEFLKKPFDFDAFLQTVTTLIEGE